MKIAHRTVLLIVYAVLVVAGAAVAMWQRSRSDATIYYVAVRTMPANHMVQAGDLKQTVAPEVKAEDVPLVGWYVRHRIWRGEKVSAESFDRMPSVLDGKVALLVPVLQKTIQSHDIGADRLVRLCAAETSLGTARARAVMCQTDATVKCAAIVDVDPEHFKANAGSTLPSLRAIPENASCR
jgi:hypothetical protein